MIPNGLEKLIWEGEKVEIFNMNEQELTRWRIIEDVLNKKLTQKEAATSLSVSERQLRNLITAYKKLGKEGLISKHRDRISNNKYDKQLKDKALQILAERYPGYGPTLSTEKLHENHGISCCIRINFGKVFGTAFGTAFDLYLFFLYHDKSLICE